MSRTHTALAASLVAAAICGRPCVAQNVGTCGAAVGEAYLDIGNVRARILNNGGLFWRGSPHVYNVPKGGPANAIFASGLWIGGMVGRQLHVAGSTYGPYEFWAGPLDDDGRPPADCSLFDRVWRVSRYDVAHFEQTRTATPDLRDWPTGLGAPTLNAFGDPIDLMELPLAARADRVIDLDAGERPDISGDQMVWWIMNDRGNVHNRTDSPPLGLEVHGSAFAFDAEATLGNTTFYRYRLFLRNSASLHDAYFAVFSDPDLGNFDDDYVGSDSVLGLAFAYNADNHDEGGEGYGEAPPAVGYDFLQVPGPGNDSRAVDEDGVLLPPKRMTASMFYNGGGGITGDPANGRDMYNFMRGRWKDGQSLTYGGNGRDFSNTPANFMYPSHPPDFWSEMNADGRGTAISPADRRFVFSTGPFQMEDGDAAEMVFAIITSFGDDHLHSVDVLKEDSQLIQRVFDSGFKLAPPPDAPRVRVISRDREVFLEWDYPVTANNHKDSYLEIDPALPERLADRAYVFEGYNIYRYESPADHEGRLVATFDVANGITRVVEGEEFRIPTATGSDSGIQHYFRAGGLDNYRSYWFGVQAYAYSPNSAPKVYKGPIARVEAVPSRTSPYTSSLAERLALEAADNIAAGRGALEAARGIDNRGSATVSVNLLNPAEVSGLTYEIAAFDAGAPEASSVYAGRGISRLTGWRITRSDDVLVDEIVGVPQLGELTGTDAIRFDGLSLNVHVEPWGIKAMEAVANLNGHMDPPFAGAPTWLNYPGPPLSPASQQETTDAVWLIVSGQTGVCPESDCSPWETFLNRSVHEQGGMPRIVPYDWEIRFTGRESHAWEPWQQNQVIQVPFELWRTGIGTPDDPTDDVRLIPLINDIDRSGSFNLLRTDHPASPGPDDPYTDWFYWHLPLDETAGDSGYRGWLEAARAGDPEGGLGAVTFGRMALMNMDGSMGEPAGSGVFNAWRPETGTIFRISTSTPLLPGDRFNIDTGPLVVQDDPPEALRRIGITPNPYVGASDYEVSSLTDQVRLTNMPPRATVRIFQLNGTLVRTLVKNSPARYLAWDLRTDENLPVGSGMYLVHIEAEGGDQIVKFGVVKKTALLPGF